jgi:hypothetical protein
MALGAGVAELLSQPIAVLKCNFDLRFRRQRCGSCLSMRYEKAPPVRLHGQSGKQARTAGPISQGLGVTSYGLL